MRRKYKSCSIFWSLSGVLEVKYDVDRTDMKKRIKTAKIACIGKWPRMHFLDLQQTDRWLNDCLESSRVPRFMTLENLACLLEYPSLAKPIAYRMPVAVSKLSF